MLLSALSKGLSLNTIQELIYVAPGYFKGYNIVLSIRRNEYTSTKIFTSWMATQVSTITKQSDILIIDNPDWQTNEVIMAHALGCDVLTEDEFLRKYVLYKANTVPIKDVRLDGKGVLFVRNSSLRTIHKDLLQLVTQLGGVLLSASDPTKHTLIVSLDGAANDPTITAYTQANPRLVTHMSYVDFIRYYAYRVPIDFALPSHCPITPGSEKLPSHTKSSPRSSSASRSTTVGKITITKAQCKEWESNPTVNPLTGKTISPTAGIYKAIAKACKDLDSSNARKSPTNGPDPLVSELYIAVLKNDDAGIQSLLAKGANPIQKHPKIQNSPYAVACKNKYLKAAIMMLEHGVDPNHKEVYGSNEVVCITHLIINTYQVDTVNAQQVTALALKAGLDMSHFDFKPQTVSNVNMLTDPVIFMLAKAVEPKLATVVRAAEASRWQHVAPVEEWITRLGPVVCQVMIGDVSFLHYLAIKKQDDLANKYASTISMDCYIDAAAEEAVIRNMVYLPNTSTALKHNSKRNSHVLVVMHQLLGIGYLPGDKLPTVYDYQVTANLARTLHMDAQASDRKSILKNSKLSYEGRAHMLNTITHYVGPMALWLYLLPYYVHNKNPTWDMLPFLRTKMSECLQGVEAAGYVPRNAAVAVQRMLEDMPEEATVNEDTLVRLFALFHLHGQRVDLSKFPELTQRLKEIYSAPIDFANDATFSIDRENAYLFDLEKQGSYIKLVHKPTGMRAMLAMYCEEASLPFMVAAWEAIRKKEPNAITAAIASPITPYDVSDLPLMLATNTKLFKDMVFKNTLPVNEVQEAVVEFLLKAAEVDTRTIKSKDSKDSVEPDLTIPDDVRKAMLSIPTHSKRFRKRLAGDHKMNVILQYIAKMTSSRRDSSSRSHKQRSAAARAVSAISPTQSIAAKSKIKAFASKRVSALTKFYEDSMEYMMSLSNTEKIALNKALEGRIMQGPFSPIRRVGTLLYTDNVSASVVNNMLKVIAKAPRFPLRYNLYRGFAMDSVPESGTAVYQEIPFSTTFISGYALGWILGKKAAPCCLLEIKCHRGTAGLFLSKLPWEHPWTKTNQDMYSFTKTPLFHRKPNAQNEFLMFPYRLRIVKKRKRVLRHMFDEHLEKLDTHYEFDALQRPGVVQSLFNKAPNVLDQPIEVYETELEPISLIHVTMKNIANFRPDTMFGIPGVDTKTLDYVSKCQHIFLSPEETDPVTVRKIKDLCKAGHGTMTKLIDKGKYLVTPKAVSLSN